MLSNIVRPLVQTQIRLLANSMATRSTLIETIVRWLGYLGVKAQITQLEATSNQIQVSLIVGQPEASDFQDWQKILQNLRNSSSKENNSKLVQPNISEQQQTNLARLLAYLIQAGHSEQNLDWKTIENHLMAVNLDQSLQKEIKAALKVPQTGEQLLKKLDPDVVVIALPIAFGIALLDGEINSQENQALSALLEAMR